LIKIESITFYDTQNRFLFINGNHVQNFPITGGDEANMINTKVWNQHGNTHIEAYMESYQGELAFIIPTFDMTNEAIADRRMEISNICNPLNGTVTMKIVLNNGKAYNRDITFISTPSFPIGYENRNRDWQIVQLFYEANNPFWYEEETIVETFQTVEPTFYFNFTFSPTAPVHFGNVIPSQYTTNFGQVEAPVLIRITGACINPLIENKTTGEFIKFKNLTMSASDVLIIETNFGNKKVVLNGQNIFNKLDFASTFFSLKVGQNEIDFTDDSGSSAATIHLIYRHLYLAI
jgi:hypothetical protein